MEELKKDLLIKERYRLRSRLGEGSFGEVWLSEDTLLGGMPVAIKFYQRTDAEGQAAFTREYTRVQHLKHDNLLTATYFDVYQRRPFLVMDYCSDGASSRYRGNMNEEQLWQFAHDVAAGLAYMHRQEPPIIHQDIKPGNVLVHGTGRFVITDFGISRSALSSSGSSEALKSAGTVAYMGPERFQSRPETIMASDIWSLGASLYELATGDLPFEGKGGIALKLGFEMPILPPTFSNELTALIQACMARETWDRPRAVQIEEYTLQVLNGKNKRPDWLPSIRSGNGTRKPIAKGPIAAVVGGVAVVATVIALVFGGGKTPEDEHTTTIEPTTIEQVAQMVTNRETRLGYWTGPVVDDKPSGEGTLTYYHNDPDHRTSYTGMMQCGQRHGYGKLLYSTGNKFVGTFKEDEFEVGTFTSATDKMYFTGTFRNNMPYNGEWHYSDSRAVFSRIVNGVEK